jgi:hypothetical protein
VRPALLTRAASVEFAEVGRSLAYTWFRALSNLYVAEGLT